MNPRDETNRPNPPNPEGPRQREQVEAYLDGELPPEEARDVLRWLGSHPDALKDVEEARRISSLLGLYADEPVAEGFAETVLAAVGVGSAAGGDSAAPPAFTLLRGRSLQIAAVAAGLVLAVGLGVLVGSQRGGASSPASATVAALEAVPAEWLENGDIGKLADLSDDDFEALMAGDPDDLAKQTRGDGG